MKSILLVLVTLTFFVTSDRTASAAQLEQKIAAQAQKIAAGQITNVGGIHVSTGEFIGALYTLRNNAPIWSSDTAYDELVRELMDATRHGFRPQDFDLEALGTLRQRALSGDPDAQAEFEVAATAVAARLLQYIYYGKVDPRSLDANWTFEGALMPGNPAGLVNQYLEVASLGALVDDIEVSNPAYRGLQQALQDHIAIAGRGGWPSLPAGEVLKPGMSDDRLALLRARLRISGDYAGTAGVEDIYDDELARAVKAFQTRHGLEADGVIGPKTVTALNRTVDERIGQLRASLERARWVLRELGDNYVFVNIGGPETYMVRDGKQVWRGRSIVGRDYRQTPVFRDEIEYIEFNPTWTVPYSIFSKDKLPKIRSDLNYLAQGGYTVLDADGQRISPAAVNWSGNPRVTLRQEPGPRNALGQVKFMFPNEHAVYLHDTDNRSLFDRNERNLSSGCVRIENPFEFADQLLKDDPDWSPERREAILASGKTTRISLGKPMPVLLTYFTAWMDDSGTLQFREDIYGRDQKVLDALTASFSG